MIVGLEKWCRGTSFEQKRDLVKILGFLTKRDVFGQNTHHFRQNIEYIYIYIICQRKTFYDEIAGFEKKSSLALVNFRTRVQGPIGRANELGALGPVFGPHVRLCGARIRVTRCPVLVQVHAKGTVQGPKVRRPKAVFGAAAGRRRTLVADASANVAND